LKKIIEKFDVDSSERNMLQSIFIILFLLGNFGNTGLFTILGVNEAPVWVIVKIAYSNGGIPYTIFWFIEYELGALVRTVFQVVPFNLLYNYLKSRECSLK
jgi:hypothetical protein